MATDIIRKGKRDERYKRESVLPSRAVPGLVLSVGRLPKDRMKQKEKGEERGRRRNGRMKREENFFKGKKMGKHNTRYHSTRSRQSSTDRHRLRTSHRNGTEPKTLRSHPCRMWFPFVSPTVICYWNTKLQGESSSVSRLFRFSTIFVQSKQKVVTIIWFEFSSYLLPSPRTASHLSRYPIGGTLVNFKTRFSFFSFLFGFLCLICSVWLQQPNDTVSQFRHGPSAAAPNDDDNNPDRSRPGDIAPPFHVPIADDR